MAKPQTRVTLTLSNSRSEKEEHQVGIALAKALFAVLLFGAVTAVASAAQTFRVLANFDGTNGSQPFAPLLQGTDGKFYGTSLSGGTYGSVSGLPPPKHLTYLAMTNLHGVIEVLNK